MSLVYYVTYYNGPNDGLDNKRILKDKKQFILSRGRKGSQSRLKYTPRFRTEQHTFPSYIRAYMRRLRSNVTLRTGLSNLYNRLEQFKILHNFSYETQKDFYYSFRIPKSKGGYRHITAPVQHLKDIQKEIADFFVYRLQINPHDAAHAYVTRRDGVTNANMHKHSKHIVNVDLKDFFPSITKELLKEQLLKLPPFAIIKVETDLFLEELLDLIIEFATLEGVLPQGSPLSPLLSNLIMVEFDYHVSKINQTIGASENFIVYTRYADDLTFSSLAPIQLDKLIPFIEQNLYGQLKINYQKVKYLKNTHRCFVTGVKINEDNQATFGHEKKKKLKHDLFNLFIQKKENCLDLEEAQEILGQWAYLYRIEPSYAKYLANKYLRKFNSNAPTLHKHFLS